MPRPQKDNADYFSHDANASNDPKIIYLESKFGYKGYALFFKLLEYLTQSNGFKVKLDDVQYIALCKRLGVGQDELKEFIDVATDESLPENIRPLKIDNDGCIYSSGLINRLKPLIDRRVRQRERGEDGKEKQSKEKKSKVKQSKEKETGVSDVENSVSGEENRVLDRDNSKNKSTKPNMTPEIYRNIWLRYISNLLKEKFGNSRILSPSEIYLLINLKGNGRIQPGFGSFEGLVVAINRASQNRVRKLMPYLTRMASDGETVSECRKAGEHLPLPREIPTVGDALKNILKG